jgi:tetratricopeptide (TPR) repeat protein
LPLPIILLALDVHPLRRVTVGRGWIFTRSFGRVFLEKLLYAVPAIAAAGLAWWAQERGGALRSLDEHPLGLRIGQAGYGVLFYVWKTLWPTGLLPLYEQRLEAVPWEARNIAGWLFTVSATVVFTILRKTRPSWLVAWVVYLLFLAPVLGFAQSGPQVVADRYSYFSCMSWAVLAGAGAARFWPSAMATRSRTARSVILGVFALTTALVALTRRQVQIWADSETLWLTTIERAPHTATAHANYAAVLLDRGEASLAADHARRALERLPRNRGANLVLAQASLELGNLDAAERHFQIVLDIDGTTGRADIGPLVGLALLHARRGDMTAAEQFHRRAVTTRPGDPDAHFLLGGFLASRGKMEEAIAELTESLRCRPAFPEASYRLAILLDGLGRTGEAVETLKQALNITPDHPLLQRQLAALTSE